MPKKSGDSSDLEVRGSAIHGRGVFAARDIAAGTRIGRYAGRRYAADQVAQQDWDTPETYVFGLSDGSIIDGARGGNATRYLNHSCTPNCAAFEVKGARGALTVIIESLHRIEKGQELFLDYQLDVPESDEDAYTCHCGTRDCRGTMAASGGAV